MDPRLEAIARTLIAARKRKGLSQRAVGDLAGVPQSHVSKIEAGVVDLRLTSLIELARSLEMEMMIVPRAAVPAVQSIARGVLNQADPNYKPPRRAYTLDDEGDV